jgi:hypothetical protein
MPERNALSVNVPRADAVRSEAEHGVSALLNAERHLQFQVYEIVFPLAISSLFFLIPKTCILIPNS